WMSFPRKRESIFWWSILFIASMTFQLFAGHAQISLYFMIVVLAYAVFRKALGMRLILLLGLVVLITSVQWLPLWAWLQESGRIMGTDWQKEGWFLPWMHLVQFVAPDFFGNPTTLNYWGQWNYGEFVGYVGVLPLLFAVSAVISTRQLAERNLAIWIAILGTALLFALPTPLAYLPFVLKIPILSSLQPTRLLFIVDFALAVLTAYGSHEFLQNLKVRRWMLSMSLIGAALVILWGVSVTGSLPVSTRNLVLPTVLFVVAVPLLFLHRVTGFRNMVTLSIVGLVAVDLLRFGWKFTPFTPRDYFFPETKVISFLKEQPQPFRMMSVDKRILPPNTASYFGIESIEGYDPIISSRYEELTAAIARGAPDIKPPFGFNRIVTLESLSSPLFPILNARYILSLSDLPEVYLTKVFEEGETRVYEDTRALPRVYVVERVNTASNKQQAILALYDIKDYRTEAVVEGDVSLPPVPMRSDEGVSLASYAAGRLEIEAMVAVPRLVVIADAYNPKWQATIDGIKATIVRTNYAFQGVVVSQGSHRVTLTYGL
ncbi:hypothetical protein HY339_00515, partial [Candidatus Gottesmanbacteria bacterium]|nr:hypothetical protein [Candidatus Gottesmanbacteria bacterium]